VLTPLDVSPYCLIQEELRGNPWRLLVACMMLNQTSIKQVRPIIWDFFVRWPTASAAASADVDEMADFIRTLGLQNRRAALIVKMSAALCSWDGSGDVRSLPGVGRYASDSYRMFVSGDLVEDVADKELRRYVEWATDGRVRFDKEEV